MIIKWLSISKLCYLLAKSQCCGQGSGAQEWLVHCIRADDDMDGLGDGNQHEQAVGEQQGHGEQVGREQG